MCGFFRHCCWIGIITTIVFTLSATVAIFIAIQRQITKVSKRNDGFRTPSSYRDVSHLFHGELDQNDQTDTMVLDRVTDHLNTTMVLEVDVCGVDVTVNRISSGLNAELDEFPWLALLEYKSDNGSSQFLCGGVLISSRYILTSAQCLSSHSMSEL